MERNKTILVTGFDPFGKEIINPAWEAVKLLADKIGDWKIEKLMVETVAYKSIDKVIKALERTKACYCISVGQAGGRDAISLERIARNINYFRIPDNEGNVIVDQPVIVGGPDEYISTLPLEVIRKRIENESIAVEYSESAGRFVCNHLFYGIRHYAESNSLDIKSGFIHVPYLPEQAERNNKKSSMSLEAIHRALHLAIEAIISVEDSLL